MLLEIFEIRGNTETEIDELIIKLHEKFPEMIIKKIDILDEQRMKVEKNIKEMIIAGGTEILPIFCLNGKIVSKKDVQTLLKY